jgi:hypothetical protein
VIKGIGAIKRTGGSYVKMPGRRGIGHREPLDCKTSARIRMTSHRIDTHSHPSDLNPKARILKNRDHTGAVQIGINGSDGRHESVRSKLITVVQLQTNDHDVFSSANDCHGGTKFTLAAPWPVHAPS